MWPAGQRLCRAAALHQLRSLAAAPGCTAARTLVTRSDEEYDALLHGTQLQYGSDGHL